MKKQQHLLMLKLSIATLFLILSGVLVGCSGTANRNDEHEYEVDDITGEYEITVDAEHTSICDVGQFYPAGEKVIVKLPTETEHYYSLYVNGEEQQMDHNRSDMEYTYFTFIMPDCDVGIVIADHSVDIPEAPNQ